MKFPARRSVLYVPASNQRAIEKISSLDCDSVIFDLEDAIAPESKLEARDMLQAFFAPKHALRQELIIRINGLETQWGEDDLEAALTCRPNAILLPKVEHEDSIRQVAEALPKGSDSHETRLWAMIETPRAIMNLPALSRLGDDPDVGLDCLVAGTNDLAKDCHIDLSEGRKYMLPILSQIVIAAKAGGMSVLDGVSNQYRDMDLFTAECHVGRMLGFDGKTLIHPAQIAPANLIFSPSEQEIARAQSIIAAFAASPHSGVMQINGEMVERLHLQQAQALLANLAKSN